MINATLARGAVAVLLVSLAVIPRLQALDEPPAEMTPDGLAQTRQLEAFHEQLIAMMQLPDHAARASHIKPHLEALFDVRRIAQISLGRTWRDLSETQQTEFTTLLTELIVATYADRFDTFNGQTFTTLHSQTAANGFLVRVNLQTATQDVRLDYFFRGGRVFNVAADGISDLSLRRADYGSIIKTQGYDALLGHIRRKVQEARQG